jgi:hypothetical protein
LIYNTKRESLGFDVPFGRKVHMTKAMANLHLIDEWQTFNHQLHALFGAINAKYLLLSFVWRYGDGARRQARMT